MEHTWPQELGQPVQWMRTVDGMFSSSSSLAMMDWGTAGVTETTRIHSVLYGMHNRTLSPCLAAINRIHADGMFSSSSSLAMMDWGTAGVTEMNKIHSVLYGMHNRTLSPCLAAINRIHADGRQPWFQSAMSPSISPLKPTGYNNSYFACRIRHLDFFWQQHIGSSIQ
jgi:hypothetical protein